MFIKTGNIDGLIDSVTARSMLTADRLNALYNVGLFCSELDGDFAELGCHSGGTSFLLATIVRQPHKLHAFDSFQGLPDITDQDMIDGRAVHYKGQLRADKQVVKQYLSVHNHKVIVHEGWIEDTLAQVKDRAFSLVYIDMDLYTPTRLAIEFFWPRIVSKGYIVFDDYRWGSTPGVTRAVDEWIPDLFTHNHYFVYPQLGVQRQ